jgi:hypothetical protein
MYANDVLRARLGQVLANARASPAGDEFKIPQLDRFL